MLSRLFIKNYALIEESEIDFKAGFSVITGETGAGKSILLGALSLLLGARADRSVLRDPLKKCLVEGFFVGNDSLKTFFLAHQLEFSPEIVIRREVSADGKSRSFLNDSLVSLQILREITSKLVHLNLQKENIKFLDPEFQIEALDAFAQNEKEKSTYLNAYQNWKNLSNDLKKAKQELTRRIQEKEFNQFRLTELDAANIQHENELLDLESEFKRLDQSAEISKFLNNLEHTIQEDWSSPLFQLSQQADRFKDFGSDFAELSNRLKGVYLEINDLAQDANRILAGVENDPQRQEQIDQRISLFYKLLKKYQMETLRELMLERERLENEIHEDGQLEYEIQKLEKQWNGAFEELNLAAIDLTNSREKVIQDFQEKVRNVFPMVHLPHAELRIKLESLDDFSETFHGKDRVGFWFNANPGMTLQPLENIASGGEMSRITLVIKSIISEKKGMNTLIFDEVDAGISGEAATKVGQLLRQLSKYGQIIAITHLPQIAAQAQNHFLVEKKVIGQSTSTKIVGIDGEQRIEALVELLGGKKSGTNLKKYAEELLNGFKS